MKLSKFGFNLCAQYSRHRPFQTPRREMTLPPRDNEGGELPELRDLRKKKDPKRQVPQPYDSPKIMRTPTNSNKVPPGGATEKIIPIPDLTQYMTYFDLLKSFKPMWQKYVAMLPTYAQFQVLWKKFRHS